jgi:hypothetical protein
MYNEHINHGDTDMRNIQTINVTAPAYIGGVENRRGKQIADEAMYVAKTNISQFGKPDIFETYKDALNVVADEEAIHKYGVVIVGSSD